MASRRTSKRQASNESSSASFTPTPTKNTKSASTAKNTKSTSTTKTARPTQGTSQRINKSKSKREKSTISHLVPRGTRQTAKVGQKDESLIRMVCDDTATGDIKELHFRNIPHSSIDWDNAEHVGKINNWRNQIYGRAGMKSKEVTLWLPLEELWFELYYQLSISEALTRGIIIPKSTPILEAFNATFAGQIIKDHHDVDSSPRVERSSNAFTAKFSRMCQRLRDRLGQCVFGTSGDAFVPKITMEMLGAYKAMKDKMRSKGITEESEYSEDLQEWRFLFAHLPVASSALDQDVPASFLNVEEEVAAILLTMSKPVHHKKVAALDIWALIASPD